MFSNRVWFEGGNSEITRKESYNSEENIELGNLLFDIKHWMSLLSECSFGHVNREKNQGADILSKKYQEYSCLSCI